LVDFFVKAFVIFKALQSFVKAAVVFSVC